MDDEKEAKFDPTQQPDLSIERGSFWKRERWGYNNFWGTKYSEPLFWYPHSNTSQTSQQLTDPYTFNHLFVGMLQFMLIPPLGTHQTQYKFLHWFIINFFIHLSWELLTNSPCIIEFYQRSIWDRYYKGHSVINTIGNMLAFCIGYLLGYIAWGHWWLFLPVLIVLEIGAWWYEGGFVALCFRIVMRCVGVKAGTVEHQMRLAQGSDMDGSDESATLLQPKQIMEVEREDHDHSVALVAGNVSDVRAEVVPVPLQSTVVAVTELTPDLGISEQQRMAIHDMVDTESSAGMPDI